MVCVWNLIPNVVFENSLRMSKCVHTWIETYCSISSVSMVLSMVVALKKRHSEVLYLIWLSRLFQGKQKPIWKPLEKTSNGWRNTTKKATKKVRACCGCTSQTLPIPQGSFYTTILEVKLTDVKSPLKLRLSDVMGDMPTTSLLVFKLL